MSRWLRVPPWVLVALIGPGVLLLARGSFGFYEDEGMNLIKAHMVARGYTLYGEIYSDQAPLYTWLLALPIGLGASYPQLQVVPVLVGLALLLAVQAIARDLGGRWAGLLAAAILLGLAPFLKFATTFVINVPALALACWSLVAARRAAGDGSRRGRVWLVLSGLLLGAAVAVKLATLYMVPIVVAGLLAGSDAGPSRRPLRAVTFWLASALVPLLLVTAVVPLADAFVQLIRPHTTALDRFAAETAMARRKMLLAPGFPALHLATAASLVVLTACQARRALLVLGPWLLVVGIWMLAHRPLWSHHLPDFLVPVTIAIAVAVVKGMTAFLARPAARRLGLIAPVLLGAAGLGHHLLTHDYWRRYYDNADVASLEAVATAITRHSVPSDWIISDRPILPVLANRPTPPGLALLVRKRIFSGGLPEPQLRDGLTRYAARVVVLCTDRLLGYREFLAQLRTDYQELERIRTRKSFAGTSAGTCRIYGRRS